jgi:hypothetical protein
MGIGPNPQSPILFLKLNKKNKLDIFLKKLKN